MAVRRITANLPTADPPGARDFWSRLLGLDVAMDMGWIATLQGGAGPVQVQVMSEGGSGTDVPAVSVEVDDLEAVLDRAGQMGAEIAYGPVDEPWGVRRFYLRREGVLVNILSHAARTDRADSARRRIAAPVGAVFAAFLDPARLARWLPPDDARMEVEAFDPRPGGEIRLVLTFPAAVGKTTGHTDVVRGMFTALTVPDRIEQAFTFDSDDPAFAGTMRMSWSFTADGSETDVLVTARGVPAGIDAATHEAALASSLGKLADEVEARG